MRATELLHGNTDLPFRKTSTSAIITSFCLSLSLPAAPPFPYLLALFPPQQTRRNTLWPSLPLLKPIPLIHDNVQRNKNGGEKKKRTVKQKLFPIQPPPHPSPHSSEAAGSTLSRVTTAFSPPYCPAYYSSRNFCPAPKHNISLRPVADDGLPHGSPPSSPLARFLVEHAQINDTAIEDLGSRPRYLRRRAENRAAASP